MAGAGISAKIRAREEDPKEICKGRQVGDTLTFKMPLDALKDADLSTPEGRQAVFKATEAAWKNVTAENRIQLAGALGELFAESFKRIHESHLASQRDGAETQDADQEQVEIDYAQLAADHFNRTELGLVFDELINNYLEHGFQHHVHADAEAKICTSSDRKFMTDLAVSASSSERSEPVTLSDGTIRPGKTPEEIVDDYIEGLQSPEAATYEAQLTVFVDTDSVPPTFGLVAGDSHQAGPMVERIVNAPAPTIEDIMNERGRGLYLIQAKSTKVAKLAGLNRMGIRVGLELDDLIETVRNAKETHAKAA